MKPILTLIATLPLLAACSKDSQAAPDMKAGAKSTTADLSSKAKQAVGSGVAEFQKSASETLAAIDTKLAELKAKAATATDTAKDELDEALTALNEQRKEIGDKLVELKAEAPEKAQSMYDGLKTKLAELKQSVEEAAAKFK